MTNGEDKRIKIIIIPREEYPSFRADLISLFSSYLTNTLRIDWLMRSKSDISTKIGSDNGESYYLVKRNFLSQGRGHFYAIVRILRGDYEIVQCRDTILISAVYALISKLRGVPFVYWMSFPIEEAYILRSKEYASRRKYLAGAARWAIGVIGQKIVYWIALPFSSHVFAQSIRMQDSLVEKGIRRDKITPVPMCIDAELYSIENCPPAAETFYLNRKVILYVGSIEPPRKMEVAARGIAKAIAAEPNSVFVIIGSSTMEDRENIKREFSSNPGQLLFLDQMPLAKVLRHVRRADVCISPVPDTPLLNVGTPTKLVEYLAMGARVVANRHPDQEYVLRHTGSGVLCDFNSDDFERAIRQAYDMGPLADDEIKTVSNWIKVNRNYHTISKQVASKYLDLVAQVRSHQEN